MVDDKNDISAAILNCICYYSFRFSGCYESNLVLLFHNFRAALLLLPSFDCSKTSKEKLQAGVVDYTKNRYAPNVEQKKNLSLNFIKIG